MYSKTNLQCIALAAVSLLGTSQLVYADADEDAANGLKEAQALYAKRSATDPQPIERAIKTLEKLEGTADDSDINYDILILESRAYYWQGVHAANRQDRLTAHLAGQAKADAALKVDDSYAEASYFAAINLARWGEAEGMATALVKVKDLLAYMANVKVHPTRDRNPDLGVSVDGYGYFRLLGRLKFMLPPDNGGSYEEARQLLQIAAAKAPNVPLNLVYYAEALFMGNDKQKADAKDILQKLILVDPATYNPDRVPENIEEIQEAKDALGQMN